MKNPEVAEIFNAIADILEVQEENRFRIRAYRRAAQTLENLSEDVEELTEAKRLEELPGIGKDLASKIEEFVATEKIKFYEDLKKGIPGAILELMNIQGIGPKIAKQLVLDFKIKGIDDLESKIRAEKLNELPGMKDKTLSNIMRGIEFLKKGRGRTNLGIAYPLAYEILSRLKKLPEVKRIEVCGSLRRMKDTVRDIDILVVSKRPEKIMDFFVKLALVKDILAHGPTKSSVITKNGIQVDVRVVEASSFGAALAYFTGSKEHNIKLRELAIKKGWKLNEYGLFSQKTNKKIAGKEEKDLYKALGLNYIPAQLREDSGEIELGLKDKLPRLVEIKDIKGDLHVHSEYSDGLLSVKGMAKEARGRGYEYIAITDHSKSLRIAGGLSERRLLKEVDEIRKLNRIFKDFKILTGTEVDILSDGRLDFKDSILKELDFVIAAVHTGFKQAKDLLTSRIIRAMENRHVHAIAHLTGRLIGVRDSYEIDFSKICKAAKETKTILEINSHPLRLDLNDINCKHAKEEGLMMCIGTDAHSAPDLDTIHYGVSVAQRGWLVKGDILNTYPLGTLLKKLRK